MNLSELDKATQTKAIFEPHTNSFMELELSKVYPNPLQPRKLFEEDEISSLAMSIQSDGLLQAIVVVKRDDGYMIVSGERRFKAHEWLEKKTIKAHIIDVDDEKILELALIENIQREDLTDFEIAVHIGKLWKSGNYPTKKHLASSISKSQSYISKAFSSLKLNKEIITDIEEAKQDIPLSVLDELSRVKDKVMQKKAYDKYIAKEITRDDIKCFNDEAPVKEKKKKYISFGFGTSNEFGDYITIVKGDLKGRVAIDTADFVKTSDECNYEITIKEI